MSFSHRAAWIPTVRMTKFGYGTSLYQYIHYVKPQESGNHTMTEWLEIDDVLRIDSNTSYGMEVYENCFAPTYWGARVSGLRVFGTAQGLFPEKARVLECRHLPLDGFLRWESSHGANACISWGCAPDQLYHSMMVFGYKEAAITALVKGQPVWVRIDCFNEYGITWGDVFCLE